MDQVRPGVLSLLACPLRSNVLLFNSGILRIIFVHKDDTMAKLKRIDVDAGGMLLYAAILTGLWWVLAGGSAASWIVGIPVILGAVVVQAAQHSPRLRVRLPGLLRFCGYFLQASVRGGVDVMRRVLQIRLPIGCACRRDRRGFFFLRW
jgi:hypothetical protein